MAKISWHIETRKLSELKEWKKNPRILKEKGLKDLKASIDKFGLAEPIIINTDNQIIGGHARFKVLQGNGDKQCDCYVPSRTLTDKEVEELNIRLNANIAGEFDFDILANQWDVELLEDWGLELPDFPNTEEAKEDDYEIPDEIKTDIVLDLFGGSGSTMITSEQLNRKAYLLELKPVYCQVIVDRMIKLIPDIVVKINGKEYKNGL